MKIGVSVLMLLICSSSYAEREVFLRSPVNFSYYETQAEVMSQSSSDYRYVKANSTQEFLDSSESALFSNEQFGVVVNYVDLTNVRLNQAHLKQLAEKGVQLGVEVERGVTGHVINIVRLANSCMELEPDKANAPILGVSVKGALAPSGTIANSVKVVDSDLSSCQ